VEDNTTGWWYSRNSLWQRLGVETMTSSLMTSSYSVSTNRKEAFTKELFSVFSRLSVVTTQEEHHVTRFGHSEGGVEIEEVCDVFVATENFPANDVDAISLKK
jgi:hypothetical protein